MSSKGSLGELRAEYEKKGICYDEVFKSIKTLCIKTLMTVEPQITIATKLAKHIEICACFPLGFSKINMENRKGKRQWQKQPYFRFIAII